MISHAEQNAQKKVATERDLTADTSAEVKPSKEIPKSNEVRVPVVAKPTKAKIKEAIQPDVALPMLEVEMQDMLQLDLVNTEDNL